jgi:hypothetical protein
MKKRIDGDNILYHYFEKTLFSENNSFDKQLLGKMLLDLSVWLPRKFYQKLPIILPYVVRDPSCRKRKTIETEEWGSANNEGFLRDDNSLIKGIVNSFNIISPKIDSYNGQKKGRGFVASHIWRLVKIGYAEVISNRHHFFNSFVPNIVWLPRQIAKLTDREGSNAQRMLQMISYAIYSNIPMPETLLKLWEYLPPPEYSELDIRLNDLNFFQVEDRWLNQRVNGLISEIERIVSIEETYDPKIKKIKCSRYIPSLAKIPRENRKPMIEWLSCYNEFLQKSN